MVNILQYQYNVFILSKHLKHTIMKKKTLFTIIILSITFIAFVVLGIQSVNETKEMVNLTLGLNN